jgi:DNA-binding response OmpR family regulator
MRDDGMVVAARTDHLSAYRPAPRVGSTIQESGVMVEKVKQVLLIDDDPHQLLASSLLLKRFEFDVITAMDGLEGLNLARTARPDIIVCDIMMPPPNGFMLKSLLAGDPLTADIPFIFLTSRALQADKLAALEHGVDDYLTKPFHPEELAGRIHAVLRRYETGRRQGRAEAVDKSELLCKLLAETTSMIDRNV